MVLSCGLMASLGKQSGGRLREVRDFIRLLAKTKSRSFRCSVMRIRWFLVTQD